MPELHMRTTALGVLQDYGFRVAPITGEPRGLAVVSALTTTAAGLA
ncbi:hypothetical protein [Rhodococcoides kyotonense]|uniref:Uncharacterized protein n=1 Tax=Rhodococcoides kyotonense TaxID=398843 RepID=A0A239N361_9NOCA|nr:hypothetical protein [Rhodococcus kyotonensis]SNT48874.1 hypothetical protein SAMN05421642_12746 [Rhodococcus kyotonensis]